MPTASAIANALRDLASRLDKSPHAELVQPLLYFHCSSDKAAFLNVVEAMPRPLQKSYRDGAWGSVKVDYVDPALRITAMAHRAAVCELIEPAKPAVYRCVPLLSGEEEFSIEKEAVK